MRFMVCCVYLVVVAMGKIFASICITDIQSTVHPQVLARHTFDSHLHHSCLLVFHLHAFSPASTPTPPSDPLQLQSDMAGDKIPYVS